jgi:hypothetical protein
MMAGSAFQLTFPIGRPGRYLRFQKSNEKHCESPALLPIVPKFISFEMLPAAYELHKQCHVHAAPSNEMPQDRAFGQNAISGETRRQRAGNPENPDQRLQGSEADLIAAQTDVRFAPRADLAAAEGGHRFVPRAVSRFSGER